MSLWLDSEYDKNIYVGSIKERPLPLTLGATRYNQPPDGARLFFNAFLPNGSASELLDILRERCKSKPPKKFTITRPEDKRHLGEYINRVNPKENLASLKDKLEKSNPEVAQQIVATAKNGAFFTAWADHYTNKLRGLLSRLNQEQTA